MTDKSKKQVKHEKQLKHEKHTHEKKHHGHEEISKKDLHKVHGGHNIGQDHTHHPDGTFTIDK